MLTLSKIATVLTCCIFVVGIWGESASTDDRPTVKREEKAVLLLDGTIHVGILEGLREDVLLLAVKKDGQAKREVIEIKQTRVARIGKPEDLQPATVAKELADRKRVPINVQQLESRLKRLQGSRQRRAVYIVRDTKSLEALKVKIQTDEATLVKYQADIKAHQERLDVIEPRCIALGGQLEKRKRDRNNPASYDRLRKQYGALMGEARGLTTKIRDIKRKIPALNGVVRSDKQKLETLVKRIENNKRLTIREDEDIAELQARHSEAFAASAAKTTNPE